MPPIIRTIKGLKIKARALLSRTSKCSLMPSKNFEFNRNLTHNLSENESKLVLGQIMRIVHVKPRIKGKFVSFILIKYIFLLYVLILCTCSLNSVKFQKQILKEAEHNRLFNHSMWVYILSAFLKVIFFSFIVVIAVLYGKVIC